MQPSELSFGSQVISQPGAARSATLRNSEATPLIIRRITIRGGNAASDFVAEGNCPLDPSSLDPGKTCQIRVTFTPSAAGLRTATLTIADSAHPSPLTVALTGTDVGAGDLSAGFGSFTTPPSLTLNGSQSTSMPFTVTTDGKDFLNGRQLPFGGSIAGHGPQLSPMISGNSGASANSLVSITVTPSSSSLAYGQTQQFTATGFFRDGSTKNLTDSVAWGSSSTKVATVSAGGLASTVAAGSATITASYVTAAPLSNSAGVAPGTPIVVPPASSVISGSATLLVPGYVLGGTITGLPAVGLVLTDMIDTLYVSADATSFSFATPLAAKSTYTVNVVTEPAGLTCTVTHGTGTMPSNDVTSVVVVCQPAILDNWVWEGGANVANAQDSASYGTQGVPAATNNPGPRIGSATWTDKYGNLWLFGAGSTSSGGGVGGNLNDLWMFNPTTGWWTWISGANSDVGAASPNCGTQGGPPSSSIAPGGRAGEITWTDGAGNFWLYGGAGAPCPGGGGGADLSDLWEYNPSAGTRGHGFRDWAQEEPYTASKA